MNRVQISMKDPLNIGMILRFDMLSFATYCRSHMGSDTVVGQCVQSR